MELFILPASLRQHGILKALPICRKPWIFSWTIRVSIFKRTISNWNKRGNLFLQVNSLVFCRFLARYSCLGSTIVPFAKLDKLSCRRKDSSYWVHISCMHGPYWLSVLIIDSIFFKKKKSSYIEIYRNTSFESLYISSFFWSVRHSPSPGRKPT